MAASSWSDLPEDVLVLILEKLVLLPDCIRLGAVCMSWNQIFRNVKYYLFHHSKPQPPWLMLPCKVNKGRSANFFSLSENKIYRIPLPIPSISRRRICYGSSHGWLITVDNAMQMHLVNPLTRVQMELPPVDTLPFVDAMRSEKGRFTKFRVFNDWDDDRTTTATASRRGGRVKSECFSTTNCKHMRSNFFEKAVLSSPPSSFTDFTVMIIYNPAYRLAFTRAGDTTWSALRTHDAFDDIIHHRGQFYAVSRHGSVYVFDPNIEGGGFKPRLVIGKEDFERDDRYLSKYLVESLSGELMMVMRDHKGRNEHALGFKLFILSDRHHDEKTGVERNKWSQLNDDMGDNVIFIGINQSMSVSASKFPELRRNCIYFTDDYFLVLHFFKKKSRDMGLFDMGSKTIVKPMDFLPKHFPWPPPVWFTPNIL